MSRTRLAPALPALLAALLLAGCGNALLFYETGKLSLTLEGRPDSSQPVQGNVGFKQRTAVVAPPMTTGEEHENAASMISSFLIQKDPGWGAIHIRTGLVTGKASRDLTSQQASEVAQIVAGISIPASDDNAKLAIENAKANGDLVELKSLTNKEWKDLTPADKDRLRLITGALGEQYTESLHNAIQRAPKE